MWVNGVSKMPDTQRVGSKYSNEENLTSCRAKYKGSDLRALGTLDDTQPSGIPSVY